MEVVKAGMVMYAVGFLSQFRKYRRHNVFVPMWLRVLCFQVGEGPLEYRGTVLQVFGVFLGALGLLNELLTLPPALVWYTFLVGSAMAWVFVVFGPALFGKRGRKHKRKSITHSDVQATPRKAARTRR